VCAPAVVCTKPMVHTMSKQDTATARRRRVHSAAFKDGLIARSLQPGASVSALALEAGINANLLFNWRRMHLRARRGAGPASMHATPTLLPVTLSMPVAAPAASAATRANAMQRAGSIEIDVEGARVRLRGAVDLASLRSVLQALRERA
jgi:transposase